MKEKINSSFLILCFVFMLFLWANNIIVCADEHNLSAEGFMEVNGDIPESSDVEFDETPDDNNPSSIPFDLDLGDYQTQMMVGEKQLLDVTILPIGASSEIIHYTSSSESVATINSMGRITALEGGTTEITVQCGVIEKSFELEIKTNDEIKLIDVDLGVYNAKMTINESQKLSITPIPESANIKNIHFLSSNEEVAQVNGLGRITAVGEGTTTIEVKCDDVIRSFSLEVNQKKEIKVIDLDLGMINKEMIVGEQQVLSITPIPIDAVDSTIQYSSSDEDVVAINALGRIIAEAEGKATITIKCGIVEKQVQLQVKEKENIKVTDIDLGAFQDEMTIGETQVLGVTIIPSNATKKEVKFSSSDEDIAEINAIGRIFAVGEGRCTITVSAGGKKKSFRLGVKKEVVVTDIELGEYEEELAVDKRMSLNAKAIPVDAVNTKLSFESSDEGIATVSSSGEIVGISKGRVVIFVKAGDVEKEIDLLIKIATDKIEINTTYLILKKGEFFQLDAVAKPDEAQQHLEYRSADTNIASVTKQGKIKAEALGNTSIIVSNGDLSKVVTIIVNELGGQVSSSSNFATKSKGNKEEQLNEMEKKMLEDLEYHNTINVEKSSCNLITKPILKKLLETHSTLAIVDEKYKIIINGKDIVNYENELLTEIVLSTNQNRSEFVINECNKLPGKILVSFSEEPFDYKFLYLFNSQKQKYELLTSNETISKNIHIDEAGKYFLAVEELSDTKFNIKIVMLVAGGVCLGFVIYCIFRNRYWFW